MRSPRCLFCGVFGRLAFAALTLVTSSTVVLAQSQSGFTYNGVVHVSFQPSEYNTSTGTASRTQLVGTHANWAAVLVTQYQANATATTISADANRTPTDAAVVAAIQEFHNQGLKVMLKPHVDSEDGAWRGTFQPSNIDTWFASYTTFITHYAQLAQANHVEGMVMGTEFVQLSGSANQARWTSVINAIRAVFTGQLAYAANAVTMGDEFTSVSFWDQLDLIGLDAYYRLTNTTNPTIPQLVAAWSANSFGENGVAAYENIASAHPGKPVIFTEIGYRSVDGANTAPFDFGLSGAVDDGEQRDCAEAMFEVWSTHTSFMKGLFWWDWSVPPPVVATDTDYNPRNKLAEGTLQTWFGTSTASSFSLSASPSTLTVNRGASGASTITISRTNFTSSVAFSATGLPTGVTAVFNPTSTTGNSSVLTLSASSTATLATATVTITGTGGGQTHSTTLNLTVGPNTSTFTLSASPSTLAVNRGASGTSTINIARTNFTSSVALTATGMPAGVTAAFNPQSTTGNSSTLTLSASSTATLGATTITVTGAGGGVTATTTIALTVGGGGGNGGVTVTPVVTSSSGFFNEEQIRIANTAPLTALAVTIVVQRTTGIGFSGQYNTIGGQIAQANSSTSSAVTYTYTLNSGQTLGAGTNWTFAAQMSGSGTAHPTAGDTYTVTYMSGGANFTQSGHF